MAMTIQHYGSAMLTLGEVAKNNSAMTKNLKKLASGQKINSAGDDASGYAISEKMRVRIRALEQDTRNTQTGSSMLRVAEGGVQSIIDELRTLKELALNAANDTNTDLDRATIQKEFDQRRANIDNIAVETNYNGKILLNGDFRATIDTGVPIRTLVSTNTDTTTTTVGPTSASTTAQTGTTGPTTTTQEISRTTTGPVRQDTEPSTGTTTETSATTTATDTSVVGTTGPTALPPTTTTDAVTTTAADTPSPGQSTDTITTTSVTTNVTESTETKRTTTTQTYTTTTTTVTSTPVEVEVDAPVTTIPNGTTSITSSGVYKFASDYTGTLTISASDVTLIGAGSTLNNVYIVDNGVDTLSIKDLVINNTQEDKSAIAFDSTNTNNKLRLLGTNSISNNKYSTYKAIINVGGGLSIVGSGSLTMNGLADAKKGAMIGTDANGTCGDISIGQGVTITTTQNTGSGIGSGVDGTCGNISIGTGANVSISLTGTGAAAGIGAFYPSSSSRVSHCGDITIYSGATVTTSVSGGGAGLGSGDGYYGLSECGDITIYSGATVTATGSYRNQPAHIGTGYKNSKCGDITIYDGANITAARIGTGVGSNNTVGTITNPKTPATTQNGGELDTTNPLKTKVTKYDVTTTVVVTETTTVSTVDNTTTTKDTTTTTDTEIVTNIYDETVPETEQGNPLVIHHGTRANEAMHVHLEDMRTTALKGVIPNDEDAEQLSKLSATEAAALQAVLDEAKDMTLDDVSVNPRESANVAIRVVDGAIQYALDQATTIGAYISRLGFTESNLVTATENTIQSESTIRDADMAKEMAEYTKNNVLLQASQSMLAQANQNTSTVLGLLQ